MCATALQAISAIKELSAMWTCIAYSRWHKYSLCLYGYVRLSCKRMWDMSIWGAYPLWAYIHVWQAKISICCSEQCSTQWYCRHLCKRAIHSVSTPLWAWSKLYLCVLLAFSAEVDFVSHELVHCISEELALAHKTLVVQQTYTCIYHQAIQRIGHLIGDTSVIYVYT